MLKGTVGIPAPQPNFYQRKLIVKVMQPLFVDGVSFAKTVDLTVQLFDVRTDSTEIPHWQRLRFMFYDLALAA